MSAVPRGAAERGDGLEVAADDYVFTVGDAAFENRRARLELRWKTVGGLVIGNFVLHLAAVGFPAAVIPAPISTPFDGLDAHYGLSEAARRAFSSHCAWLPRPTGMLWAITSKMPPTVSPAFKAVVDFGFHFVLDGRVDAAERRIEIGVDG